MYQMISDSDNRFLSKQDRNGGKGIETDHNGKWKNEKFKYKVLIDKYLL